MSSEWMRRRSSTVAGANAGEDAVGILDGRPEASQQVGSRERAARVEFALPIALVSGATDAADDPLPHVAGQVKNQVSDAVRLRIGAPPELLVGQPFHRLLDSREVAVGEQTPGLREEGLLDHVRRVL